MHMPARHPLPTAVYLFILLFAALPFLAGAATLGSTDYDLTFLGEASYAKVQNLGNGTFAGGGLVTGIDIRASTTPGNNIIAMIRVHPSQQDVSAATTTIAGEHVYHFDFPEPVEPKASFCYELWYYVTTSTGQSVKGKTIHYGWTNEAYTASSSGCSSPLDNDDVSTGQQNSSLNAPGLRDYSFVLHIEDRPLVCPAHCLLFQSAPEPTGQALAYEYPRGTLSGEYVWQGEDFTIDANTTIRLWARWNGKFVNTLRVQARIESATTKTISRPGYLGDPFEIAAPATSTLEELIIPMNEGVTIQRGDIIRAYVGPKYDPSFGANHWIATTDGMPFMQICQGMCTDTSLVAPPACTENCFSNVLFLPGIESSRLYRPQIVGADENKLWEPGGDDDVRDLYLRENGEGWRADIYTKEGDVLDELPVVGQNIYKSFIAKMDELKSSGQITDWQPAAYDWRLSLDEILSYGNNIDGQIYYSGRDRATSTPYIIQELRRLAASSKSGKVTIIAHSNGGLVAKQLTTVLGEEASDLIDKMIFVAVPQAGTPMAAAAGLHGYDQALGPGGLAMSSEVARSFASTSPMFYHLLPSADYFTYVDDPIIKFDPVLTDWIERYGDVIHSEERLHDFLVDSYGRVDAETGDLDQPTQLKEHLLAAAESVHDNLDNWIPPEGVELIQIAGWGVPTTVSGLTYKKKGPAAKGEPNFTIDGDGTVVVPSALWTTTSASTTNYWLDLKKYNNDHKLVTLFGKINFDHSKILETDPTLSFLSDLVTDSVGPVDQYGYISLVAPPSTELRLRFALHSPLTLNAYDSFGNHTGISTTTNQIEEGIPGSYYTEFGDVKYLFTDPDIPVHIVMEGYDAGTFTFTAEELHGDDVQTSTAWQDMPVIPDTQVTIDQSGDFSTLSPLSIDKNGDGNADYHFAPVPNGTITFPPITVTADDKTILLGGPLPEFTATLSGFAGGETATTSDVTGAPECTTTITNSNTVGAHTITCTIGTLSSDTYEFEFATGTLNVIYSWSGFLQPINDAAHQMGQDISVFKSGSTVPVKFQIKNDGEAIVQTAIAPQWSTPEQLGPMSSPIGEVAYSSTETAGTTYKWDETSQQHTYNWSTKGFALGYWYRISVQLDDGNIYQVIVGLK